MSIADNLARLWSQVDAACSRVNRDPNQMNLVAVTKTCTAPEVEEAIQAEITDIGENRVQEAAAKKPLVAAAARWHLVGSLQTNKVKKALELFDVIQSVDSFRLAEEIQRRCEQGSCRVAVLAEVNTSGEATKHGIGPGDTMGLIEQLLRLDRLELQGLMTIGPGWAITDPEASRHCFRSLAHLAAEARQKFGIPLPHLSMGMSSDFEVGIEEGATIIRIGTAIFGPRPR